MLVFGLLSFFGAAAVLLLPETRGVPLPQTLVDGNEFGKKKTTNEIKEQEER